METKIKLKGDYLLDIARWTGTSLWMMYHIYMIICQCCVYSLLCLSFTTGLTHPILYSLICTWQLFSQYSISEKVNGITINAISFILHPLFACVFTFIAFSLVVSSKCVWICPYPTVHHCTWSYILTSQPALPSFLSFIILEIGIFPLPPVVPPLCLFWI